MLTKAEIFSIYLKVDENHGLSPQDIGWYYSLDADPEMSNPSVLQLTIIRWLGANGFEYPMIEEKEVEFKLRFL